MTEPFEKPPTPGLALQAYLLGTLDFDALLAIQRRLAFDISGDRDTAALIVCEHPPLVTIGRHGSRSYIANRDDTALPWPVRWVARGGGCLLHLPGQIAIYPILPLDALGLDVGRYLDLLQRTLVRVAADFDVTATFDPDRPGARIGGRLLAPVGVAVREWVSTFGAAINVGADVRPFRRVRSGPDEPPMTSLESERRSAVRPAPVRQSIVERFTEAFRFGRVSVTHSHPAIPLKVQRYAFASARD